MGRLISGDLRVEKLSLFFFGPKTQKCSLGIGYCFLVPRVPDHKQQLISVQDLSQSQVVGGIQKNQNSWLSILSSYFFSKC